MSRYYGNVTFMLCLPRSRSAWLCHFLAGAAITMHEPLKNCASIDELGDIVDFHQVDHEKPMFIADTAATFFLDQIRARFPGARYLIVHRDREDVIASLERMSGQKVPDEGLALLVQEEQLLAHAADVLRANREYVSLVHYDDMNHHLYNIYRFVGGLGALLDAYMTYIVNRNIQVPLADQMKNSDATKFNRLFATRMTP